MLGTGQRVGSVWKGDLYLRGDGDPTLTTADIGRLAASLRASGIRSVAGRVRGDETAFDRRRSKDSLGRCGEVARTRARLDQAAPLQLGKGFARRSDRDGALAV